MSIDPVCSHLLYTFNIPVYKFSCLYVCILFFLLLHLLSCVILFQFPQISISLQKSSCYESADLPQKLLMVFLSYYFQVYVLFVMGISYCSSSPETPGIDPSDIFLLFIHCPCLTLAMYFLNTPT